MTEKTVLTATDRKVLALFDTGLVDDHGGLTCTQIGSALYPVEFRNRQGYARTGGRAARRLVKLGLLVVGDRRRSDGKIIVCFYINGWDKR